MNKSLKKIWNVLSSILGRASGASGAPAGWREGRGIAGIHRAIRLHGARPITPVR